MTFLHKQVEEGGGTFGSQLRDLRELQELSFKQVVRETKIQESLLRAFEEDRIEELDDPVFAERHLMAYVRYLGAHEPYFLARYKERLEGLQAKRHLSDLLPRKRGVREWELIAGPQVLALIGILIFGALLGAYVLWQAHLIRTPPTLTVTSPTDGMQLDGPTVTVSGTTMREAEVTVNGKDAPVDAEGHFTLSLDVRRGTTIVTIIARRRRGSETRIDRSVVYDAPLSESDLDLPMPGEGGSSSSTDEGGT